MVFWLQLGTNCSVACLLLIFTCNRSGACFRHTPERVTVKDNSIPERKIFCSVLAFLYCPAEFFRQPCVELGQRRLRSASSRCRYINTVDSHIHVITILSASRAIAVLAGRRSTRIVWSPSPLSESPPATSMDLLLSVQCPRTVFSHTEERSWPSLWVLCPPIGES
jgi:hypothetical protein